MIEAIPSSPAGSLLSAPQGDCLWRSSLKVPRATRPLSDCCSRSRDPLASSEDRDSCCSPDGGRLVVTHQQTHTLDFNSAPCLNVYINTVLSTWLLWRPCALQLIYFVYALVISEVPYCTFIDRTCLEVLWLP